MRMILYCIPLLGTTQNFILYPQRKQKMKKNPRRGQPTATAKKNKKE